MTSARGLVDGRSAPDPGLAGADLADLPLFRDVDPALLAALAPALRRRRVPAGTHLITVEQPGEVAYVIVQGTVKVYVDQEDGTEVIIALRGPGELVGEMSLLDGEVRSASVVATELCHVLWLDRATFDQWLQTIPRLTYNLARILARRLRGATMQLQVLAALEVESRVARHLLMLAAEYGTPAAGGAVRIPLRLTQSDLAGLVGASRARVNEVIVAYKRAGWIAVDAGHHISVNDQDALARRGGTPGG